MTTTHAGPVGSKDRLNYLDILRGFAVMAIFIVNIKGMAMPFAWYMNVSAWGEGLEQQLAILHKFLVEDKWRTIFTALYGAGLIMMWDRLQAKGQDRQILWRRNLWLMLFGAVHLYLIWIGDILFLYAVSGLIALQFVPLGTIRLVRWAIGLLVIGWIWSSLFSVAPAFSEEFAREMAPIMWDYQAPENIESIAAYQGGVWDQLSYRAVEATMYMTFGVLMSGLLPVTVGLMLMGMVLFRIGFLQGQLGAKHYLRIALTGFLISFILDAIQVQQNAAAGYTFETASLVMPLAVLDGWAGGLGYAALVGYLFRLGMKFSPVAAVGRMAFTNYIACSLIGTTLAGGHGFGFYGQASLTLLMAVVLTTFIAMLIWSPIWLRHFRFGPLEWLWRSLVYGERQPFRR